MSMASIASVRAQGTPDAVSGGVRVLTQYLSCLIESGAWFASPGGA